MSTCCDSASPLARFSVTAEVEELEQECKSSGTVWVDAFNKSQEEKEKDG